MFYYNVFHEQGDTLLAVCDKELMGKTLEEGSLCIVIDAAFYGTNTCDGKKLTALLREATIVNAIGTQSILFLVEHNYIEKENVHMINGIPHAQIITVS